MSQRFCSNCGAPLSPGAKHCSSCGNAIPSENTAQPYPPVQDAYQRPQYTPQPSGNNDMVKVLIGILIVLVMAGIGLGIWLFAGKSKEPVSQETDVQQETIKEMKASNDSMKASYDQLKKQIEKKSKEPAKVQYVKQKPTSIPPSEATRVVINGVGVRMRIGPGKEYGFLQYYNGKAYTVSKGTSLPFLGAYGNWYKVLFEDGEYYVSADFAYLR